MTWVISDSNSHLWCICPSWAHWGFQVIWIPPATQFEHCSSITSLQGKWKMQSKNVTSAKLMLRRAVTSAGWNKSIFYIWRVIEICHLPQIYCFSFPTTFALISSRQDMASGFAKYGVIFKMIEFACFLASVYWILSLPGKETFFHLVI